MSNIFIDCGFYKGKAVRWFKNKQEFKDKEWKIIAFEPNVKTSLIEQHPDIEFHTEAIWINNGTIEYHSSARRGGQANGLYKNPRARDEKVECIPCVNFSEFITQFKDDYLIVKMDIEGAEYEVITKLIIDETINYIDEFYIEFHHRYDISNEYIVEFKKNLSKYIKWKKAHLI